jgi:hypothetical protein
VLPGVHDPIKMPSTAAQLHDRATLKLQKRYPEDPICQ